MYVCNDLNGSQENYAWWKKKTNILFHIPYDPIYIIVLKWQNFRNGLVAASGRDRGWCDYKH